MNSCIGKSPSCRKGVQDDRDNLDLAVKYQRPQQRKSKIDVPKSKMRIENIMSTDTSDLLKGSERKNNDSFALVDIDDFDDMPHAKNDKTPENQVAARILPMEVAAHENLMSFGQKFDSNKGSEQQQKYQEIKPQDNMDEISNTLQMEKHRKITFKPINDQSQNQIGQQNQGSATLEQLENERKQIDSDQSQSITIGSTVHPKQGDHGASCNSANVNLFDVTASHYNEEDNDYNNSKQQFFDLAHFGPKKKRSSTDPGKYHQQQVKDQDVSQHSRNPFSDNQTQTISQRDDISQHQSIILDGNEISNKQKMASDEILNFQNNQSLKSLPGNSMQQQILGYSSNSMVQPQRKTVSKKSRWGFLSFLSGSVTNNNEDKVISTLQQKKQKSKKTNQFLSQPDLSYKNSDQPVVEDIPDELFQSKMDDPVQADNYQSISKTLRDADENYVANAPKSSNKYDFELPDGGSLLSDDNLELFDNKKKPLKTIDTSRTKQQFNQQLDMDQNGNPYAHLLQKSNITDAFPQNNFQDQLQSNYTDMTDEQFAFGQNIESDVSGDEEKFGFEEDDNSFNFEKHNPDKDDTFPGLKANIKKAGQNNLKEEKSAKSKPMDEFEDILDYDQKKSSKSPKSRQRQFMIQQEQEDQENTRHTMNPVQGSNNGAGDLSISFRDQSRNKLITMHHNNKKNVFKKLWHKAPVLNINTYKIQFSMQGEKVSFDHHDSFPICLLGIKFKPEKKPMGGQNYSKDIKKRYKDIIKTKYFESIIWCSYRNKLENDILSDPSSQRYLEQVLPKELSQFVSYSSDMNWGCTVRVGQMLICNTLMRHLLIDSDFRYTKADVFDKFGLQNRFSISYLLEHPSSWEIYQNVLAQVIDNKLPEDKINGISVQPLQAFQIQNVSKMAVATQSIMPGTWFGVQAVSHLYCKLNRLFRPLCDNFQICVLGNGFVHFNRIISKMRKVITIAYTPKQYDHLQDEDEQVTKQLEKEGIESIFHDEIHLQRKWKEHFRIIKYPGIQLRHDQGEVIEQPSRVEPGHLVGGYRNGCLVIINCMLGVYKIEKEYFDAIRYIFHEPNIMMGAMGGRPGQALYFVGLQNYELIFLDPHLVQEAPIYGEDEWIDCELNKDEFTDFRNQINQMNSSASMSLKQKFKKSIPLKIPRKFSTKPASESNQGPQYPKIRLKESDRQTYHCGQMRKIHISKCDPTMAFSFYLRNEGDLRQFYWLMKRGKDRFGSNWPFSLMDIHIMDEYFKEYKEYQNSSLSKQWVPSAFGKQKNVTVGASNSKITTQSQAAGTNLKQSIFRQQSKIQELSNNFIPKPKNIKDLQKDDQ